GVEHIYVSNNGRVNKGVRAGKRPAAVVEGDVGTQCRVSHFSGGRYGGQSRVRNRIRADVRIRNRPVQYFRRSHRAVRQADGGDTSRAHTFGEQASNVGL